MGFVENGRKSDIKIGHLDASSNMWSELLHNGFFQSQQAKVRGGPNYNPSLGGIAHSRSTQAEPKNTKTAWLSNLPVIHYLRDTVAS